MYPIRTKFRSLRDWFAAEPTRFTRERSPKRMVFWGIVAVVGLVLTVLVYLNPEAVIEFFGGRRRGGMAVLGSFLMPPAMIVVGIVFQFYWVHRFRIKGGGVLQGDQLFIVPGDLDVREPFRALAVGGQDLDGVRQAMRYLQSHQVDPRHDRGQKIVVLTESPDDRTTFAGVLRMDETKRNVLWINHEPLTLTGEHYFKPQELHASLRTA